MHSLFSTSRNAPEVKVEEKVKASKEGAKAQAGAEKKEGVKIDREKETFVARQRRQEDTREQRQVTRERVRAAIQSAGIFAAITSTGTGPAGPSSGRGGVTDLLGAASDGIGDLGNINIGKGTFATRNVDVAEVKARRGAVTQGVDIARESVGKARAGHIASGGSINITSTPPEVTGNTTNAEARTQASIQRVINLEQQRIKRVYENWLKRDPALAGQLRIKFTIMPDGSVTSLSIVSSSTKNSEFDDTILRYVKRWAFSPVEGGGPVEVVFPFVFEVQA